MEYHITGNCADRGEIVVSYIKLEFSLQGIYLTIVHEPVMIFFLLLFYIFLGYFIFIMI